MQKKILALLLIFFTVNVATFAQNEQETQPTEKLSLIKQVEHWYENNMNYLTITALMTVESSFIPFPSEVVIPPAAYIASKPESNMNIFLVVLFGTIGALIGAYINYFLALWLGRPVIYKFADSKVGKLLMISGEKVQRAEDYFNKKGVVTTLIGRLIPVIRQLISLPAGLARMNLGLFTIFTTIGALIWNIVLALVGYLAHGQADLIDEYNKELSIVIVVLLALFIIYLVIKHLLKRKKEKSK
jgi:Uncharacterized membrane-associated protein